MGTFAIENINDITRFINILDKNNNPILNMGDECYVMINGVDLPHLPIVCKARIVDEKIVNIIDKIYVLQILDIRENQTTIEQAFLNKCFEYRKSFKNNGKNVITNKNMLNGRTPLFVQQNAFFIRQDIDELRKIQEAYIDIVKKDLQQKLQEINEYRFVPLI